MTGKVQESRVQMSEVKNSCQSCEYATFWNGANLKPRERLGGCAWVNAIPNPPWFIPMRNKEFSNNVLYVDCPAWKGFL